MTESERLYFQPIRLNPEVFDTRVFCNQGKEGEISSTTEEPVEKEGHKNNKQRLIIMAVFVVNDEAQKASTVDAVEFFAQVDRAVALAKDESHNERVRVAFDCEGVNLGRFGSIELVSLVFQETPESSIGDVFVVDVGNSEDSTLRSDRVSALKKVFECKGIEKIIHDCRMDCDALFHHCDGIRVYNVHDTSCFHTVISGLEDKNLNDCLYANGLSENTVRDKSIYRRNPSFWATRPLTSQMLDWTASDVDKLLKLADKQAAKLDSNTTALSKARVKSTEFSEQVINMKMAKGLQCMVDIGPFIGRRGCNLRSLQRRTGTLIYSDRNSGQSESWIVYYKTPL